MAALSKPSLRSSTRKTATLDHVPPADSLPVPRRGKRTRNSSLGSQSSTSVKRFKSSPQEPPCSNPIVQFPQSLPIRDKAVPKPVGTQVGRPRKEVDPPQPHIELPAIAKHNEQAFRNNNSVDLNTFDVLNTTEKRSLRSHDGGSRSKSELALYFANYDELVSIEPKEPGMTMTIFCG